MSIVHDLEFGELVSFGPFRLAPAQRLLLRDDKPIAVRGRRLDLLIALTSRAPNVVSKRDLMHMVWPDVVIEDISLRVHINALRKTLGEGEDGVRYIVNVPGRGYSFVAQLRRSGGAENSRSDSQGDRSQQESAGARTIPVALPSLLGRSDVIANVSSQILSRRFVSLTGPGGIGKTTVAIAIAHSLRAEFGEESICFVDFGSLTAAADVPIAVASALGCLVHGPDVEPYILAVLANRRVLIVFDSCEHVIDAAALLSESLFRELPLLHLLTTSREILRAQGETVHLLTPLDTPGLDSPSATDALASPAVQLFMERATSSGHGEGLNDAEAPIVAEICRRLDGVPLAIELAASRVGTYGIQGTADLLDSGAALVLRGRRSALPRHQTLQAMFDWSYQLLSVGEQTVINRLSVFAGGFVLQAARVVAAESESDAQAITDAVASLVDKSLIGISSTPRTTQYRLLDTTRSYVAARLEANGESNAVAARHARYLTEIMKAAESGSAVSDGRRVAGYACYMPDVRKALGWCFSDVGDVATGIELAARTAPVLLGLSLFAECQLWCKRALAALPEAELGGRRELDLQEALARSAMYTWSDSKEVRDAIERGLELSTALGDSRDQFYLLSDLNVFLTRRGEFGGALAAAKRCAALAGSGMALNEQVISEWTLGASYHLAGNQAAAMEHGERGFKLASGAAATEFNLFYETRGRFALARSLWLCGYPDRGATMAREAIVEASRYRHHFSYGLALIYSIPVLLWNGDLQGATEPIDQVMAHAAKYSLAPFGSLGMALKGELLVGLGKAECGVQLLEQALTAMRTEQYNIVISATSRALAEGLARCGRMDEAKATIDLAVESAERAAEALWLPELLRTRGQILLALPLPDETSAEKSLLRAIDCARQQSALGWELKAAIPLANLWRGQRRHYEAKTTLSAIYQRFTEGFGTSDMEAARQLLEQM